MNIEHFKTLFKYNNWANDRVWEFILDLSEEQFTRAFSYSIGSVHDQAVHMMTADELWLERIRDGHSSRQPAETHEYPTRDAIATHWQAIRQNWEQYLDTLTASDLDGEITFSSVTYSTTFYNKRWEGLIQVINHSTDHRAQILSLIHQVGVKTDAQDFIFFTWGK